MPGWVVIALAGAAVAVAPTARADSPRMAWATSMQTGHNWPSGEQTYRNIVRPTAGGHAVRIRLSNRFGPVDATFGAATIATRSPEGGAATVPGSLRPLTFAGRRQVTIPPGGHAVSDFVDFDVVAGRDLAISLFPSSAPWSYHIDDSDRHYGTKGVTQYGAFRPEDSGSDHTSNQDGSVFTDVGTDMYWLDGVEVMSRGRGAIAALGDSLTDGAGAVGDTGAARQDAYDRYPDHLTARLAERGEQRHSVLNLGVSGHFIADGLARLESDVLSRAGLTHVIVCLGSNDLGFGRTGEQVRADLEQLAGRLRTAGLRVIGGTIPPRAGLGPPGNLYRHQVNDWIRTSPVFDGVADFDLALRHPLFPDQMRTEYTTSDGIHPNPDGYRAMAQIIDLGLFEPLPLDPPARPPEAPPPPGEERLIEQPALRSPASMTPRRLARRGLRMTLTSPRAVVVRARLLRGERVLARATSTQPSRTHRLTLRPPNRVRGRRLTLHVRVSGDLSAELRRIVRISPPRRGSAGSRRRDLSGGVSRAS